MIIAMMVLGFLATYSFLMMFSAFCKIKDKQSYHYVGTGLGTLGLILTIAMIATMVNGAI